MKLPKPTKGPWRFVPLQADHGDSLCIVDSKDRIIATIHRDTSKGGFSRRQDMANAQHIVNAVALADSAEQSGKEWLKFLAKPPKARNGLKNGR